MDNQLITQLEQLLEHWDTLAEKAEFKAATERERYYYGVMFGIEAARADLKRVLKEAKRGDAVSAQR